jgi:hypothetical protein
VGRVGAGVAATFEHEGAEEEIRFESGAVLGFDDG